MKNLNELEETIERYKSALEYIMKLSNKENPHLGHPRSSVIYRKNNTIT